MPTLEENKVIDGAVSIKITCQFIDILSDVSKKLKLDKSNVYLLRDFIKSSTIGISISKEVPAFLRVYLLIPGLNGGMFDLIRDVINDALPKYMTFDLIDLHSQIVFPISFANLDNLIESLCQNEFMIIKFLGAEYSALTSPSLGPLTGPIFKHLEINIDKQSFLQDEPKKDTQTVIGYCSHLSREKIEGWLNKRKEPNVSIAPLNKIKFVLCTWDHISYLNLTIATHEPVKSDNKKNPISVTDKMLSDFGYQEPSYQSALCSMPENVQSYQFCLIPSFIKLTSHLM